MISKKIILGTLGGLVVLASTCSSAAQIQLSTNDVVAREASEGPRGEGKGHKNGIDTGDFIIAREATEAPRGADNNNQRRNRGGRVSTENVGDLIIAREASEGPRGRDRIHTGTHKNGVDNQSAILA